MNDRVQIISSCHQCIQHVISFDPASKTAYHLCLMEEKIIEQIKLTDLASVPDLIYIKIPYWCALKTEIEFADQFNRDIKEGLGCGR